MLDIRKEAGGGVGGGIKSVAYYESRVLKIERLVHMFCFVIKFCILILSCVLFHVQHCSDKQPENHRHES